jgi:hypothetical protein
MNTRLFQQIEVCFLDLVIDLLSNRLNPKAVAQDFIINLKNRPVFVSSIILGSTGLGMVAGYIVSVVTP